MTLVLPYLAGILTKVLADMLTDRLRARKQKSVTDAQFAEIELAMPALLQQMRDHLATNDLVRDFVTLRRGNVFTHGEVKRFEYFVDEHPDLAEKIAILESHGYIEDVRVGNHPIYRMTPEFVRLLRRSR